MFHRRRQAACLASLLAFSLAGPASAQAVEYDVTVLGKVPGSYITYSNGMNDHGVAVGMAMFIPGGLKAWTWSASQGFALLPTPPTISDYGAVDINNAGVIAGDGGGDGGEIWRYTNGTYEMLGFLPGTPIPRAAAIGATGNIAGACYGTSFYYPRHSFVTQGSHLVSALDNSVCHHINDVDQLTGVTNGNVAYRISPGVGVELLPPLGGRFLTAGYSLNNGGKVVGVAASSAEHSGVPFLFSDSAGMQEIGDFGGRAYAWDVNDQDEVVGGYEPFSGSRRPWVWSPSRGVRFLNGVIDPALGLSLRYPRAINDAGQVLIDARDSSSEIVQVLLTPRVGDPTNYCDPPNANSISAGGALLSHVQGDPGGVITFQIDDTPIFPGVLYFGTVQLDQPFGCGRRCVGGTIVRSGVYQPTAQSFQAVLDTTGTATTPFDIQYWYRDPDHLATCGSAFNLTNALGF